MAGRPISLPPRPLMLAGREEILGDLRSRLSCGGDGVRVVCLHGMGGTGKSSLAIEYAYRHQATASIVWRFPAQDQAMLADAFGRLAGILGVGGGMLDPRDPVAAVHAVLAASSGPWLLVFDDAPSQQSVQAFLPPAGNAQVLITSQDHLWPHGQGLEVPLLEPHVAARFLTARTGDSDQGAAAELAGELGGLPLALEQAASYLHATGNNLADYLGMFRQRHRDLLARGRPTGYNKTVATTWNLAIKQIEQNAPQASGLLRLLACCAPEPVPLSLLLQPTAPPAALTGDVRRELGQLPGDPVAAGDAIAELRRYSLLNPAGHGLVLIHRLVQIVTRDQMSTDAAEAWRKTAATLVEAAIPSDTSSPEAWPACAMLLPHARAALPDDSDGMARVANYLGASGNYKAARDLSQKIANAREKFLGPEHLDTLIARGDLAAWTGEAGDPAAARDLFAMLVPDVERILGPEHREFLSALVNFATWTGAAGDLAAARDLFDALVPDCARILGPNHPHTLVAREGLATWTGEAGDPAAARDLFDALVPDLERILGDDHFDTLSARASLAGWTVAVGGYVAS